MGEATDLVRQQVHTRRQGWRHIEVECTDVIDDILETLAGQGPYAYTVMPAPVADGDVPVQHIAVTRDEVRRSYEVMHAAVALRRWRAVTEIVTDWYAFNHGVADVEDKATGDIVQSEACVLFPTMGGEGITGELFWARSTPGPAGWGAIDGPRLRTLAEHERLLGAVRAGDVDVVVAGVHPDAQAVVRDYLDDTGTVVSLAGRAGIRAYLERFFGRFRVRELDVLHRHVDDWFVFAELAWTVQIVGGGQDGTTARFRTAEYAEVGPDGLIRARIGHGTALAGGPRP